MKNYFYILAANLMMLIVGCSSSPSSTTSYPYDVYRKFKNDVINAPFHFAEYQVGSRKGCNTRLDDFDAFVTGNFEVVQRVQLEHAPSGPPKFGDYGESLYEVHVNDVIVVLRLQCHQEFEHASAKIDSYPKPMGYAEAKERRDKLAKEAEERKLKEEMEKKAEQQRSRSAFWSGVATSSQAALQDMHDKLDQGYVITPSGQSHDNEATVANTNADKQPVAGQEPENSLLIAGKAPKYTPIEDKSGEYDPDMTVSTYEGPSVKTVKMTRTYIDLSAKLACTGAMNKVKLDLTDKMTKALVWGEEKGKEYGIGEVSTGRCSAQPDDTKPGYYKAEVTGIGHFTSKKGSSTKAIAR